MTAIMLDICLAVGGFVITAIPSVIVIVDLAKKKKNAKTEAEKLEAEKLLQEQKQIFIEETEALYKNLSPSLKAVGLPVGQLKKDSTMTKLRMYAINNNLPYDEAYYSAEVDKDIDHTNKVNAKEREKN